MSGNETEMRVVTTTDGLSLAVAVTGPADAPTLVCIHGYPDNRSVWDGVTRELSDRYRVVRYDVRGAGDSEAPSSRAGYSNDQLAADLDAVIGAVSPDRPVHLLGHDWGSIQTWHAVTGDGAASRAASFTSISGPCLDLVGLWITGEGRDRIAPMLTQSLSSTYIGWFHVPWLPEALWRSRVGSGLGRRILAIGAGATEVPPDDAARPERDLVNGLEMYRANMRRHLGRPRRRHTSVPVQVLTPTRDVFVTPALQECARLGADDVSVRPVVGGHWVVRDRPAVVAGLVDEHIRAVTGSGGPGDARDVGGRAAELVVITGAGSGIGRATAVEYGSRGATVVIADRDLDGAERTARQVGLVGGTGVPYRLDVTDADAWQEFADDLRGRYGVPDVVINNAGIGMGGGFLETTRQDWQAVIDVNLWGVIHGCRVFGEMMRDHGTGGQLVNLSSAAAFLPSRILPAYGTTKAAVLALSESLRGDLARYGIGVTVVCPGFVNTGISRSTHYVGMDEESEERTRRAASGQYARRNYGPEKVARAIVRAADRNSAVVPVTAESRIGMRLHGLAPGLLRALARADLTPG
ncbi:SDR family oxidoreductase [Dietzia natronolimnaea]|uniref:SDR family oxidoreductase n=1 Tax=Dietzia natronolimnaea TaxID=161920 RepID=UPI003D1072DC